MITSRIEARATGECAQGQEILWFYPKEEDYEA